MTPGLEPCDALTSLASFPLFPLFMSDCGVARWRAMVADRLRSPAFVAPPAGPRNVVVYMETDGRAVARRADRHAALASHKTDSFAARRLRQSRSGQFKTGWIPSQHVARSCSRSRPTCVPPNGTRRRRTCSHSKESGTGRKSPERALRPSVAPTPMPCGDAWGWVQSEIGARVGRPAPAYGSLPGMGSDVVELSCLAGGRLASIGIEALRAQERSPSRR
jgi:hypothetical protein